MGTQLTKLSNRELGTLKECEQAIERGVKDVGHGLEEAAPALKNVRESKLYREHYQNWAEYCRQRWCIDTDTADGWIRVWETGQLFPNTVRQQLPSLPRSIREDRLLRKLPIEKRPIVWKKACKAAQGHPGPKDLKAAVEEELPPEPAAEPDDEELVYRDATNQPIPEDLRNAWEFHTEELPKWVSDLRALRRRVRQFKADKGARFLEMEALLAALDRVDSIMASWERPLVCDCETDLEPCPFCGGRKLRTRASFPKVGGQRDPYMSPKQQTHLARFGDPGADYPQLARDEATRRLNCYFTGHWAKPKQAPEKKEEFRLASQSEEDSTLDF